VGGDTSPSREDRGTNAKLAEASQRLVLGSLSNSDLIVYSARYKHFLPR
jgi:hypothetical protein